jgi:hypothetical protein
MKPKPTLNTMGVQFALQEPGENIQWTGVWVGFGQGIRRTQNSEICPKINRGNLVRRQALMPKCARVVELFLAMHNSYYSNSTTAGYIAVQPIIA